MRSPTRPKRLPYVEANTIRGVVYLYYRRAGRRIPLAGPEGSAAFLSDYQAAERSCISPEAPWGKHTVGNAITEYPCQILTGSIIAAWRSIPAAPAVA